MPLQNRVLPTGEIVAIPARGTFTGNRGVLHRADRTLGVSRWKHRAWITCALAHKGWHREVMTPNRWSELFFLDEAVALAAGHRPCALCRRAEYNRFRAAWTAAFGTRPKARDIDRALHQARIVPGTRQQWRISRPLSDLPEGAFCLHDGLPHLVRRDALLPWTPGHYRAPVARPDELKVQVLTPRPVLAVIAAGYVPALHVSAGGACS